MRFLAEPLSYILKGLYSLVGNYGISLIIMTVIIKLALYPIYARQIKSTAKMTAIQPKIQQIQQKYAKDQKTMNEKISELYKQEGVSMSAGCLPMIIQMIVLMGLFALLRNPMNYMQDDTMILAIHESFLWIQDLAQPDPWILPIAAGVTTFLSFNMSASASAGTSQQQQQSRMMNAIMKYLFPIMILWMARSYPAGLATYWFISQFIQIFFNLRFARMRKKMQEEANAPKGKKKQKKVPVRA